MTNRFIEPIRVRCICVNCREETWQPSFDEEDRGRKTPKSWACGCCREMGVESSQRT